VYDEINNLIILINNYV